MNIFDPFSFLSIKKSRFNNEESIESNKEEKSSNKEEKSSDEFLVKIEESSTKQKAITYKRNEKRRYSFFLNNEDLFLKEETIFTVLLERILEYIKNLDLINFSILFRETDKKGIISLSFFRQNFHYLYLSKILTKFFNFFFSNDSEFNSIKQILNTHDVQLSLTTFGVEILYVRKEEISPNIPVSLSFKEYDSNFQFQKTEKIFTSQKDFSYNIFSKLLIVIIFVFAEKKSTKITLEDLVICLNILNGLNDTYNRKKRRESEISLVFKFILNLIYNFKRKKQLENLEIEKRKKKELNNLEKEETRKKKIQKKKKLNIEKKELNTEEEKEFHTKELEFNIEEEKEFNTKEKEFNIEEEKEFNTKEKEFNTKEKEFNTKEKEFNTKEKEFNTKEKEFNTKEKEFNTKELEFNTKEKELNIKEKEFNTKELEFNTKELEEEKKLSNNFFFKVLFFLVKTYSKKGITKKFINNGSKCSFSFFFELEILEQTFKIVNFFFPDNEEKKYFSFSLKENFVFFKEIISENIFKQIFIFLYEKKKREIKNVKIEFCLSFSKNNSLQKPNLRFFSFPFSLFCDFFIIENNQRIFLFNISVIDNEIILKIFLIIQFFFLVKNPLSDLSKLLDNLRKFITQLEKNDKEKQEWKNLQSFNNLWLNISKVYSNNFLRESKNL